MDILSGDISGLIFKYITRDSIGKFSLDGQLLSVLAELDGRKSLAMIANTKGLSMEKIRNIILFNFFC